jgi:hypothetical protein
MAPALTPAGYPSPGAPPGLIRQEVSRVRPLELAVQTLTERQVRLIERVASLERTVGKPKRSQARRKTA